MDSSQHRRKNQRENHRNNSLIPPKKQHKFEQQFVMINRNSVHKWSNGNRKRCHFYLIYLTPLESKRKNKPENSNEKSIS
jgi:hypothetical protein